MIWKKGIVVRAFAPSPNFLGSTDFIRSVDDFSHVFRRARAAGFEGVQLYLEISSGVLNLETSDDLLREIAGRASEQGISLTSLEIAPLQYSFTSDDPTERKRGVEVVGRAMEIAKALGSPGVLVIPGYVGKMWDPATDQVYYEDAYNRTLECLRFLVTTAEKLSMLMLVEPIWNMFLLSPLEMRRLIDEVGSRFCGVLLDTGNVTLFGFAEQWVRALGTRIKEIHLKDFRRQVGNIDGFVPLLAGDVNWAGIATEAQRVGFEGFWIAEQFPYQQHGDTILQHTSEAMDKILGPGRASVKD